MLPFSRPLGRCSRLGDVVARPLAPGGRRTPTRGRYVPHQPALFLTRSLEFWAPKTPLVTSSESTGLPRGAWDSHVHVVDEVSNAVQAAIFIAEHV